MYAEVCFPPKTWARTCEGVCSRKYARYIYICIERESERERKREREMINPSLSDVVCTIPSSSSLLLSRSLLLLLLYYSQA